MIRHAQHQRYWAGDDGERAITAAPDGQRRDEGPTGHPWERGVRPREQTCGRD